MPNLSNFIFFLRKVSYYNLNSPIIQKLPEFSQYLKSTLLQLKKWNDLIN